MSSVARLADLVAPERLRPLRRAEFEWMVEAGLFRDERVEPLQGWLVEISPQGTRHAALNKDRLVKAALYAAAAVQEYWIVDLPAGMIEVHTEPVSGRYTRQTPVRLGGAIRLQAFPDVELQVADILR